MRRKCSVKEDSDIQLSPSSVTTLFFPWLLQQQVTMGTAWLHLGLSCIVLLLPLPEGFSPLFGTPQGAHVSALQVHVQAWDSQEVNAMGATFLKGLGTGGNAGALSVQLLNRHLLQPSRRTHTAGASLIMLPCIAHSSFQFTLPRALYCFLGFFLKMFSKLPKYQDLT